MNSDRVSFVNILGVGKNGTTLIGSLLDNHKDLSTFPLEMKFIDHYFNTIKDKSLKGIIEFILEKSKITQLGSNKITSSREEELKRVVTGNLNSISFDKTKLEKILSSKITNSNLKDENLEENLIFVHRCLNEYLNKPFKNKIVIQDGCFGLRYIEQQIKIFSKVKFIIIVRNPLDVYVSFKKITRQFKFFRRFIGDFSREEELATKRNNLNYFIVNNIFQKYKNDNNFFFLKYEDLVTDPSSLMKKLANFLDIEYSDNLLSPTVFGQDWLGNSTSVKEKKKIDNKEIGKYIDQLNFIEKDFLTSKFQTFFKNFGYKNEIKKFSKMERFKILLKIYSLNIKERKNVIPKKRYTIKQLYYLIYLNNLFFFRNLFDLL